MVMIIDVVAAVLAVPVVIAAGYLLVLTVLSSRRAAPALSPREPFFDIVVPSHNEERVIAQTVQSLLAIDWPAHRRRILVVADNCKDGTAAVARAAGAEVLERFSETERGKGYALAFGFQNSAQAGLAEAVVVVDADTLVTPNLLKAFAARLHLGAHAMQAHYGVSNPFAAWRTTLMAIALGMFHRVRGRGREALRTSAGLRGNGMCFTHELLKKVPHDAFSVVEDLEYGLRLGRAGFRVWYVDEADVRGEMVTSEAASRSQRVRWESGRKAMVRQQAPKFLVDGLKTGNRVLVDLAMDLLVPPLSYVALGSVAVWVAGVALWWFGGVGATWAVGSFCVLSVGLYVARGWAVSETGFKGLTALASAPFYIVWKVALMRKQTNAPKEWVRTTREAEGAPPDGEITVSDDVIQSGATGGVEGSDVDQHQIPLSPAHPERRERSDRSRRIVSPDDRVSPHDSRRGADDPSTPVGLRPPYAQGERRLRHPTCCNSDRPTACEVHVKTPLMRSLGARRSLLFALTLALSACRPQAANAAPPRAADAAPPPVLELAYGKGVLQPGWMDFGYAARKEGATPIQHNLTGYGGFILARQAATRTGGGVAFSFQAPATFNEALRIRLKRTGAPDDTFPPVNVSLSNTRTLPTGWKETWVPMTQLNPRAEAFDQIVLYAWQKVSTDWVTFDNVAITAADPKAPLPVAATSTPAAFTIDCKARKHRISPLIYGIAYYVGDEFNDTHQWNLGATARRWGGNQTTRYNWQLGNAWNAGSDWYFRNLDYIGPKRNAWEEFLASNQAHDVVSTVTVPIIGWVAKDSTSFSFPASKYPDQEGIEQASGAGNGKLKNGSEIASPAPSTTSIEAPPEFVGKWVKAMLESDAAKNRTRTVRHYILDNEPALWNTTHRDLHPAGVSYDELLQRTIDYGTAVRKADPQGVISGPAEWGWTNYFSSAADRKSGGTRGPDRAKHGNTPLIPWYLAQLAAHEKKTGTKVLDILDLHFYPQTEGMGLSVRGDTSNSARARRIRATRALWDPTFKDESWIAEPVMLIPRMQKWVAESYPGLGTQIGEWNFGAENDISGGLATAEALGRFGQQNLTAAYYWSYPAKDSASFTAFRAFRNYDGQGAHFQDWSLPTTAPQGSSLFASVSDDGTTVTAVALNLDPDAALAAKFALTGCGAPASTRTFTYSGTGALAAAKAGAGGSVAMAPYSMTVMEWKLAAAPSKK